MRISYVKKAGEDKGDFRKLQGNILEIDVGEATIEKFSKPFPEKS